MAPTRDIKAPLLEAEPPTASVTRHPVSPLADAPGDLAEQEMRREAPPVQPPTELPSELRLDGLDFDLDGLGLGKTARSQPSELPPLEMKPGTSGARKPSETSLLERGIAEPPTESSSLASTTTVPTDSPKPDLKFEFADVTQEIARPGAVEEPLKLDEALQNLGGDTLKLGGKQEAVGGVAGGISATDYVETKLDLASAYLEMGDQVGARSLLDEVLREGDATQRERAKAFLKKLG
jgi:pilus assembly protein FimV